MTVLELRTAIETKLRDANNQILTDAQFLQLLNEAQEEWAIETNEVVQLGGLVAVPLQSDYTAPASLLKIRQGWWLPLYGFELEVANEYEHSKLGGHNYRNANYPGLIMQRREGASQRLIVWPPPSSAGSATTLNGGINDSVTTVAVTSAAAFRSPSGYFQVDSEIIYYQNVSGNNLLLCRRGALGTTAASHSTLVAATQVDILFSYSRTPAALTGDSSVPELLPPHHTKLQWYVLYHALLLDGRPEASMGYQRLWEVSKLEGKKLIWRQQAASPAKRIGSPYSE